MALISRIGFTLFDRWGNNLGRLPYTKASHIEALDLTDELKITCDRELIKGQRIVWIDRQGIAHEHLVDEVSQIHDDEGKTHCKAVCINSIAELLDDYIEDKRPSGGVVEALTSILSGTRWSVGRCDQKGSASHTFYHISVREGLTDFISVWGGELEVTIETDGTRVTRRSIGVRACRGDQLSPKRFTWTKDLINIKRKTGSANPKTRVYGYGKGVETEGGGFGRRLTFGEINGGKDYVEDTAATDIWGHPDGNGGIAPAVDVYINEQCDDPAQLLQESNSYLETVKEPQVSYEADVVDLYAFGRSWEGVALGDRVAIIDKEFSKTGIRIKGRVSQIERDLITVDTTVTFGNLVDALTDMWETVAGALKSGVASRAQIDAVSNPSVGWLKLLQSALNAQFNAVGTYKVESFELGQIFSNVALNAETGTPVKTTADMWAVNINGMGIRLASSLAANGQWDWTTFITGASVNANCINVGTLRADRVRAGLLTDEKGKNCWDLDAGEFRLSAGTTVGNKDIATTDAVIASVDVEYAQGASRVTEPQGGWQTTAPQWVSGKYIWTRTKTTMQSGDIEYSEPVCISGRDGTDGAKGDKGSTGTGVSGIVEQYYLSTSSAAQSGGSWSEAQPAWSKGKYIWTRSKVTWTDGSTTYTAPCLAKAINGSNQMAGSAIVSRVKLYAKNQSDRVPPINAQNPELGWSKDIPQWSNGYFIWEMDRITYGDGSVNHSSPVLVAALNKANQSAYDLNQSLSDLDTTVNDLATDGVVTEAEKAAVKKIQQTIDKEKDELTTQYNGLKSNKSLDQYFLGNVLGPTYNSAFGTGGSYDSLNTAISDVLKCTTKEALDSAMATYKSCYNTHSSNVNTYTAAARQAQHAIEQQDAKSMAQGLLDNYDDDLNQLKIFNRLTNNGAEQGIYMQDGKLYMNASYIAAGIIADVTNTNSWNLKTGYFKTTRGTIGGFTIDKFDISNNRLSLRDDGPHFIYDSKDIGFIGSNHLVDYPKVYGLNFNLKESGGYMSWAAMKNADDPYYAMKLTYANKPNIGFTAYALNAGCDLDMRDWSIKSAKLDSECWVGGGLNATDIIRLRTADDSGYYDVKIWHGFVYST
jgi:phage minor structural protein